jgi:hypothetical protein
LVDIETLVRSGVARRPAALLFLEQGRAAPRTHALTRFRQLTAAHASVPPYRYRIPGSNTLQRVGKSYVPLRKSLAACVWVENFRSFCVVLPPTLSFAFSVYHRLRYAVQRRFVPSPCATGLLEQETYRVMQARFLRLTGHAA